MSHPLGDIPELNQFGAGRSLVRIPIEQDVPFTDRVRAVVDTPEFQRLRHITQLGLAAQVYPGATHTRFEHALGVFHNALRYLWQLGKDERFAATIDQHAAEVLLVSALLHDLGHWPFCHPIEDMGLEGLPSHETLAREFLAEGSELSHVLERDWNVRTEEILEVLTSRGESARIRLLQSILSGPIDIDKMDYLDRDSLHCGVPYGRNFDRNRLMTSLLLNEAGDGLAIGDKGKTAAELMVFARYVMFSEVYWHHAVRSATAMFARAFYSCHERLDPRSLVRQTETETINTLFECVRGSHAEPLLDGIFGPRRRLYKRVAEFSPFQHRELYDRLARRSYPLLANCAAELARRMASEWNESISETAVLIDAPPPAREIEFRVDIYFPKEKVYRPLAEVSPVITALARTQFDDYVKRVRVFAAAEYAERLTNWPRFHTVLDDVVDQVQGQAEFH